MSKPLHHSLAYLPLSVAGLPNCLPLQQQKLKQNQQNKNAALTVPAIVMANVTAAAMAIATIIVIVIVIITAAVTKTAVVMIAMTKRLPVSKMTLHSKKLSVQAGHSKSSALPVSNRRTKSRLIKRQQ